MIIKELKISGFGKLINKQVNFDDEMTLVHGSNEAGKSTMYAFVKAMLFGFPRKNVKTRDYEPKEQALFGGELILEHPRYGRMSIKRFKNENKGKAIVSLEHNTQTLDETFLKEAISPLNEELFDEVFRLDLSQLESVSSLSEENLQKQLLNIGLTGSKKLLDFQQVKQKENEALFLPRGKNPQLNQTLEQYESLRQQIAKKESVEKSYQVHIFDCEQTKNQEEELEVVLNEEQRLLQRLEKQIEEFPTWQKYIELKEKVAQTEYDLSDEDYNTYQQAYQKYQVLDEQERRLTEEQLMHTAKTDSEELAFYLNNEDLFIQFKKDRPYTEGLAHELELLKKMKENKEKELVQLSEQLQIKNINETFFPETAGVKEIQELSKKEKTLTRDIEKQQIKEKTLLEEKRQLSQTDIPRKTQRASGDMRYLYAALGASLFGLGFVVIFKQKWLGIVCCLIALGLFLYFLYDRSKDQTSLESKERTLAQIEEELVENNQWLFSLQREQEQINKKKNGLSDVYQFQKNAPLEEWLDELNLRARLFEMQIANQETIEKIAENEKRLEEYADFNPWIKDKFYFDIKQPLDKINQISSYIANMQEKQQQYLLENTDTYQVIDSLKNVRQHKQNFINQFQANLDDYGLKTFRNIPDFLDKQIQFKQIKEQLVLTESLVKPYYNLDMTYHLNTLTTKRGIQQEIVDEVMTNLKKTKVEHERLKYAIMKMEEDGLLAELYQEEANLRGTIEELQEEWMVNKVASSLIQEIQDYVATEQLPGLLETCSEYFNRLTLENYNNCTLEDGQLLVAHKSGELFSLDQLSTGTKDQLYMAMRLAFIYLHSEEQISPLMVDDGWLHYDQERKTELFKLLQNLSPHVQVICFSSDNDLLQYSKEQEIGIVEL